VNVSFNIVWHDSDGIHETFATNHREALTGRGWAENISAADTAVRLSGVQMAVVLEDTCRLLFGGPSLVTSPALSPSSPPCHRSVAICCRIAPCVRVCDEDAAALKMKEWTWKMQRNAAAAAATECLVQTSEYAKEVHILNGR